MDARSPYQGLVVLVSGELSLPSLQMAIFLCPYIVKRDSELSTVSSYKDTNPVRLAPHPCDLILTLIIFLEASSPNIATL